MRQVRGPECYSAILVTQVENSGMCVLGEGLARTQFCAVFGDDLAGGCVLVFQEARQALKMGVLG